MEFQTAFGGNFDVLVAGGGVAGVAAAVAAARHGRNVLLLEKGEKLGGLATLGLINLFVPMCNGRGKQIIFGMAEEFLRLSVQYGYDTLPDVFSDGKIPSELLQQYQKENRLPPRYMTRFSPDLFALALTKLCVDNGVTLMFDTTVVQCEMAPDGHTMKSVITVNKSGFVCYEAKIFIDATGDCDLIRKAGIETIGRGNYHTYMGLQISLESCQKAVEQQNIGLATSYCCGGAADLYGKGHPADLPLYDATDAKDLNRYLIQNQLEMLKGFREDTRKRRDIVALPGMPQMRTACCLKADYRLTEADTFRHFEDSVGAICDFDRRDYLYEVPYRTLINKNYTNILTAGRTACADGYAWDVLRVIPPAIITGQAAGDAAAQAILNGCGLPEIDICHLQHQLEQEHVLIHFDDKDVPMHCENIHENNDM